MNPLIEAKREVSRKNDGYADVNELDCIFVFSFVPNVLYRIYNHTVVFIRVETKLSL